jgi:hypothetical protein
VGHTLVTIALARHLGDERPVEIVEDEHFGASDALDHERDRIPTFVMSPPPVWLQFSELALTFFEVREELILQEIDRLVFRKKPDRIWQLDTSCSDPLILGLCIRRMALEYRHMMLRYKPFLPSR